MSLRPHFVRENRRPAEKQNAAASSPPPQAVCNAWTRGTRIARRNSSMCIVANPARPNASNNSGCACVNPTVRAVVGVELWTRRPPRSSRPTHRPLRPRSFQGSVSGRSHSVYSKPASLELDDPALRLGHVHDLACRSEIGDVHGVGADVLQVAFPHVLVEQ